MRGRRSRRVRRLAFVVGVGLLVSVGVAYMAQNVVPVSYAGQEQQSISFTTALAAGGGTVTNGEDDDYVVTLTATLTFNDDKVGDGRIAGQPVTFSTNGQSCSATTQDDGTASCPVTLQDTITGAQTYKASFPGNGSLLASDADGSFTAPTPTTTVDESTTDGTSTNETGSNDTSSGTSGAPTSAS
ncbi:MAG TPA: hypothetical protein VFJ19_09775 [Nocardioidaceae bacterium]|nr:hypothetical protein [Nocardioidaceae bacterium]